MSGGSNSAQKAAQQQQEQQQAQVAATQSRVNQIFNDPQRQADISDFVNATREFYNDDLNRQKDNADRNLKFALAKSGLIGGSTQVDQQQNLGEAYAKGQLQAEQRAAGAGAGLQGQDEQARQRLISLATSGLDTTNAATQAAQSLQTNLQAARGDLATNGLGDAFTQFNQFATNAEQAKQKRDAYNQLYSLYGPIQGTNYGGMPGG